MALYFSERALSEIGPAQTTYKVDRSISISKVVGLSRTVSQEMHSKPAAIVNQTVRRAKGRSWQRLGDAKNGSLVRFNTQRLRLGALPILGIGGHTAEEERTGEHLLWAVIGIANDVYQRDWISNRQLWPGPVMLVGSRDGHSTLRTRFTPPSAELSHRYPHSFPSSPESLSEVIGALLDVAPSMSATRWSITNSRLRTRWRPRLPIESSPRLPIPSGTANAARTFGRIQATANNRRMAPSS